ncbi:hypothetical protein [Pseudoalteromonas rubra]|uniref:t-SNARE coiled-coil homology domain-containing protein n=1 Tax=Pseudoalteromonas rubra TaxID=43658 RepID=A0A5S3WZS6_9GAMM|nr:hypothetical protein [Pseudoalteromonas rubra]TMP37406.1 hypothetical protein CWB98_11825 [Pseudoalteromonas rubra]
MKKLLLPCVIAATFGAKANEQQLPHTFQANTPAKAAEVNENFNYLLQAITTADDDAQTQIGIISGTLTLLGQSLEQQGQTLTATSNTLTTHGGNISMLQSLSNTQSEQLTQLQTASANHTVYYGELASALAAQSSSLNGLSSQLSDLQAGLQTTNSQLSSTQGTVRAHGELLTSQGTSLANNTNQITQLNAQQTEQSARLTQLKDQVSTFNTTQSTLNQATTTQMSALNAQLGDLNTQVAKAENQVTINTGQISQLSLEAATQLAIVAELENTTASHSTSLTALTAEQSALSAKQQKLDQDLSALDTGVMDLSNAVNSNTSAVASMKTSVDSVQNTMTQHSARLTELEKEPEPYPTYDEMIDPHKPEHEFVYNYRPASLGQEITVGDRQYRMFRLPVIDMETNRKYGIDLPLGGPRYYANLNTNHNCQTFKHQPSVDIGGGAKAIFSIRYNDYRNYNFSSGELETRYYGTNGSVSVDIKIGNYTCFSFWVGDSKRLDEGQAEIQPGDYDLTDNAEWITKGDRMDEFPDMSELGHYIRVVAL